MTLTNREVVKRFCRAVSGKSNKMESVAFETTGDAFLWDYGWALLAHRTATGTIYVYDGWDGHSSTTTKHLNLVKTSADEIIPAKPNYDAGVFDADGRTELLKFDIHEIRP